MISRPHTDSLIHAKHASPFFSTSKHKPCRDGAHFTAMWTLKRHFCWSFVAFDLLMQFVKRLSADSTLKYDSQMCVCVRAMGIHRHQHFPTCFHPFIRSPCVRVAMQGSNKHRLYKLQRPSPAAYVLKWAEFTLIVFKFPSFMLNHIVAGLWYLGMSAKCTKAAINANSYQQPLTTVQNHSTDVRVDANNSFVSAQQSAMSLVMLMLAVRRPLPSLPPLRLLLSLTSWHCFGFVARSCMSHSITFLN